MKRRLAGLESRVGPRQGSEAGSEAGSAGEGVWTRFFYEHENARRELLGESRREPTDEEREALEVAREPVESRTRPPGYSAAAWEERERRFRCLFAELDRLEETVSREEEQVRQRLERNER